MPNYQWAGSISGLTPTSVAVDSDGNIYVTEASYDRLRKYSKSGVLLHTMTNLDMPKGIAVDSSGKIYIGCEDTSVVEVYSPGFTLLYKLGDPDNSGSPTYMPQPNSIDIDANTGKIYVVASGNHWVRVFNPNGSHDSGSDFGGSSGTVPTPAGSFNFPISIAIDEVQQEIVVSDQQKIWDPDWPPGFYSLNGARVQVFDMNGNPIESFGVFKKNPAQGDMNIPNGVEVDGVGNIYESDTRLQAVQVFADDGSRTYLGSIAQNLNSPKDITFGNDGRLYVASTLNSSVEIFHIEPPNITITPVSHDFGSLEVGSSPSPENAFTVGNDGTGDLVIDTVNQPSSPFSMTADNCSGQTLAPSASCTVTISFTPTAVTTYSGNFTIDSNDPDSASTSVGLSGEGINNPPSADADGPYAGVEGQSIILDGSGSSDGGSIVQFEWDVDDDGFYDASGALPTHSYTYAQDSTGQPGGVYTIRLRVTDNLGATATATTTATISDTTPTSDFTGTPTSGEAPLTVTFSNNSSGYDQPLTYEWDFDNDGTVDSTAGNPSYIYNDPGTYSVKLTVTDSDGDSNSLERTNYITVTSGACGNDPVRIYGTPPIYYSYLQTAYSEAVPNDLIQLMDGSLSESSISFNKDISVTIKGGYDCNYTDNSTGMTTIATSFTFSNGTVTIENITLE
jgi:PKD repeat protein